MRIGIVPSLNPHQGGTYQYSLSLLHALREWQQTNVEDDFVVFLPAGGGGNSLFPESRRWSHQPLEPPSLRRSLEYSLKAWVGEGIHREVWRELRRRLSRLSENRVDPEVVQQNPRLDAWFRHHGLELVLYPAPSTMAFETTVPYVMAVHDLQHRLQPEFPEVSSGGEWERREYMFRNGICRALLVLVDSEVGREDVLRLYGACGITADRIKILPFLPPPYLAARASEEDRRRLRSKYGLLEPYFFYPAQFWPHKNHLRVVQALSHLKEKRGKVPLVAFCGDPKGEIEKRTFKDMRLLVESLGLEERVRCLGYLANGEMSAIFEEALGLVMPTFFGPTNIPPLEAWALGCPVITSDIRGIREQMGDAALLIDPRSAESLAGAMMRLSTEPQLRRDLAVRGRARLALFTPEDFRKGLIEIVEEAKVRFRVGRTVH